MPTRTTKYCQNIGPRHLRGGSPNKQYCVGCYEAMKERLERIKQEGGPVEGLRAARTLADGSFGYERTQADKERNLNAFFHYCMPHIPQERAQHLAKEIAKGPKHNDFATSEGIKRVKMYE